MSPQAPYVPMHPQQKRVTQEEMWEKLAKHAPPRVSVKPLQDAQSPKEKAALGWDKPVRTGELSGYMLSQCGRYSITKDASAETVSYTAWRRATRAKTEVHLGCKMTREEAEALCNEDHQHG